MRFSSQLRGCPWIPSTFQQWISISCGHGVSQDCQVFESHRTTNCTILKMIVLFLSCIVLQSVLHWFLSKQIEISRDCKLYNSFFSKYKAFKKNCSSNCKEIPSKMLRFTQDFCFLCDVSKWALAQPSLPGVPSFLWKVFNIIWLRRLLSPWLKHLTKNNPAPRFSGHLPKTCRSANTLNVRLTNSSIQSRHQFLTSLSWETSCFWYFP